MQVLLRGSVGGPVGGSRKEEKSKHPAPGSGDVPWLTGTGLIMR